MKSNDEPMSVRLFGPEGERLNYDVANDLIEFFYQVANITAMVERNKGNRGKNAADFPGTIITHYAMGFTVDDCVKAIIG